MACGKQKKKKEQKNVWLGGERKVFKIQWYKSAENENQKINIRIWVDFFFFELLQWFDGVRSIAQRSNGRFD